MSTTSLQITQNRLKELLDYDSDTGVFTAKVGRRGTSAQPGDAVGTYVLKDDAIIISLDGRTYQMHNLAWLWVYGEFPEKQLIKLDGNGKNLAIVNLTLPASASRGEVTRARLEQLLSYAPEDGKFYWKVRAAKNLLVRSLAGRVEKSTGHHIIVVDGVGYTRQRLVWLYENGSLPDRALRFLDGDSLNTKISNLALPEYDARTPEGKRDYQRIYRQNHFDTLRKSDLKKSFGITQGVYDFLFKKQNGVCAICKKSESAVRDGKVKWMAVDHCHSTMKIRGLLCQTCNSMLGQAKDDAATLRAGADYVEKDHVIEIDGEPAYIVKKGTA